jgi:hypothetical protein
MISNPGLASCAVLDIPRTSDTSILRSPKTRPPKLKPTMRFNQGELERIMGVSGVESKVGWLKGLRFDRPDYFCITERLKNGEYEVISCGSVKFVDEQLTEKAYSAHLQHDVYVRPGSLASRTRSPDKAYAAA